MFQSANITAKSTPMAKNWRPIPVANAKCAIAEVASSNAPKFLATSGMIVKGNEYPELAVLSTIIARPLVSVNLSI